MSLLRLIKQSAVCVLSIVLISTVAFAQQGANGSLRGRVVDQFGGVIIGATVSAVDASGALKTATTDDQGNYVFTGLAAGTYTIRSQATGFAPFEKTGVEVAAGRSQALDLTLSVTIEKPAEVTVASDPPVSTDPENNAGAIVLRGTDIEALPEDPDELADALQALAGPSAGPNGGQVFIDGFTGGRLPPRESIREIRINSNPFSAEFDRLGFGRIEILTKPGTDKLRGQASFSFNDESLNSRNPFAPNRASFQSRQYGGNLSGPIIKKKASFFLDFERRAIEDNALINATILDPTLNVTPFSLAVLTPNTRTTFSPRIDYQLNKSNTLVARYTYTQSSNENSGLRGFDLLSRAFNTASTQHTVQLTETAILSPTIVNETRFQFIHSNNTQNGDNTIPTINVLDAFTGGGSSIGLAFSRENRWELSNNTSWALGKHSLKFGARLRGVSLSNNSPGNFGGTFTFAGGFAPQLDANNQVVLNNGQPVLIPITSIERYRRTLLFQQQGLTPAQISALGGGPTQFTIAGGNPLASIKQVDLGIFAQDDWRVNQNLTLSLGLRYENQTNISSNLNFAPRLAFAWSPVKNSKGQPTTVIRGGFGVFYDRVSEGLSLTAERFNGINEQQFLITDPAILGLARFTFNGVTNVPTTATLAGFSLPQTTWQLANNLQAPYTVQSSISLEQTLFSNWTFSATYINSRALHLLRARNINAPLPGTFVPGAVNSGVRPFGNTGNIYEYETSGRLNQNQLLFGLSNRLNRRFSISIRYSFSDAKSDTDGAGTFPANQYDLSDEYGRASGLAGVRHRLFLFGTINAPWGLRFNPLITVSSGQPFNITTGRDLNGDSLFTDRPAFATSATLPQNLRVTPYGSFDINPQPGEQIIPRNYGVGPAFFSVNLSMSRTFGFGGKRADAAAAGSSQPGDGGRGAGGGGRGGFGGPGGGGRGGGGGGGERGGFGGNASSDSRYNLTFTLQALNLFNRTNGSTPVGNLSSQLFGQSLSSAGGFGFGPSGGNAAAGNRRIIASLRFSF